MNKIEDQNKLIAEFMGVETTSDATNSMYHYEGDSIGRELQYHTSWNWLMPVVEKIMGAPTWSRVYPQVLEGSCICEIKTYKSFAELDNEIEIEEGTLIEATYNAVVEFIKQYNETK